MEYRIIKEHKINNDTFGVSGIWYIVEPKNWFRRFLSNLSFAREYRPFLSLKEAEECKSLLEKKKWVYTKSREIVSSKKTKEKGE